MRHGEVALPIVTGVALDRVDTVADAFDEAAPELYRAAYRVSYRILGDRTEAEDVAQETLARACVRWNRVRGYAGPWAVRVAGNLALDIVRRRRFHCDAEPEAPPSDDPDTGLRLDLQRALLDLSARERQVVTLRYLGDLPYAEVAAAIGCGVGTAKRYAARGLAKLRMTIGDVVDDA